jgi:hypothetical protein
MSAIMPTEDGATARTKSAVTVAASITRPNGGEDVGGGLGARSGIVPATVAVKAALPTRRGQCVDVMVTERRWTTPAPWTSSTGEAGATAGATSDGIQGQHGDRGRARSGGEDGGSHDQ